VRVDARKLLQRQVWYIRETQISMLIVEISAPQYKLLGKKVSMTECVYGGMAIARIQPLAGKTGISFPLVIAFHPGYQDSDNTSKAGTDIGSNSISNRSGSNFVIRAGTGNWPDAGEDEKCTDCAYFASISAR